MSHTLRKMDFRYISRSSDQDMPHYFGMVRDAARPILDTLDHANVLEVGCACGDFLGVLSVDYPNHRFTGLDLNPALIREAKQRHPQVAFECGDFMSSPSAKGMRFDVVCALTVHSLFRDVTKFIRLIVQKLAHSGVGFVFGLFNPHPINVYIEATYADAPEQQVSGWNVVSQQTVSQFLDSMNVRHTWNEYRTEVTKQSSDGQLFSSWTEEMNDGQKLLVNGLGLIHHFSLLTLHWEGQ